MSTLLYRRLRFPINTRSPLGPVDQATNNTPCMVQAGDYAIDIALFFGEPSTTSLISDVTNFAGITFQVKAATNNGAAPAPDSSALISKTVAPWTAGTVTWANWLAASAQHATIVLTAAETAITTGNAWMIVIGTTTDSPPRKIPLACGPIVIVNDGYAPGVGPPAPIENYYTQSQVNALLALKASNAALNAESIRATNAEYNLAAQKLNRAELTPRMLAILEAAALTAKDPSLGCSLLNGQAVGPYDYTYFFFINIGSTLPAHLCVIAAGEGYAPAPLLDSNGALAVGLAGVSVGTSFDLIAPVDQWVFCAVVKSNDVMRAMMDLVWSDTEIADTFSYSGAITRILGTGTSAQNFAGRIARLGILNYAATEEELAALCYGLGTPLAGWERGSMAPLNVSNWANGNTTLSGFSAFSGATPAGFTATATGNSGAQSGPVFSVKKGERIIVQLTKAGSATASVQMVGTAGNVGAFQLLTTGKNNLVFEMIADSANVRIQVNSGVGTLTISLFSSRIKGMLFLMDDASRGNGAVLRDVSGNGSHALMDGDGSRSGNVRRASPFEGAQEIGPFAIPAGSGNYLVGNADVQRVMENYHVLGGRVYLPDSSDALGVIVGQSSGGSEILEEVYMIPGMNPWTADYVISPSRVWISDVSGAGFAAGSLVWLTVAPKN